jgi:DNA invertase Pin-like site-specific DNA recombinase
MCRAHRAALVVAKVDRLARSQGFLSRILEAGVDVRFCDLPQIEGPTGRFLLQSMMAVAELEAGMISRPYQGRLGSKQSARNEAWRLSRSCWHRRKDTARARAARTLKANDQARSIAPIIDRVDPDRTASLRGIARALNDEGMPMPGGEGT